MVTANCVHARANLWRPAKICRALLQIGDGPSRLAPLHQRLGRMYAGPASTNPYSKAASLWNKN